MSQRKQQLCRIRKKNPVWRGGDVKDPGPYCKRCYHKHVWADRPSHRRQGREDYYPGKEDGHGGRLSRAVRARQTARVSRPP